MPKGDNTPWKKGVSGNPGGRPKSSLLTLLAKHLEEQDPVRKVKRAQLLVEKLFSDALEGSEFATEMVWNRLEGKLKEAVALEGADGKVLNVQLVSFCVKPDEDSKK